MLAATSAIMIDAVIGAPKFLAKWCTSRGPSVTTGGCTFGGSSCNTQVGELALVEEVEGVEEAPTPELHAISEADNSSDTLECCMGATNAKEQIF